VDGAADGGDAHAAPDGRPASGARRSATAGRVRSTSSGHGLSELALLQGEQEGARTYQVSMCGLFLTVRWGTGGKLRSPRAIQSRVSAGSITSSIPK